MKKRDAMLLALAAVVLWPRGKAIGAPSGTTTSLFPPTKKGVRSANWNGEWYPHDNADPEGSGFYLDSNRVWWFVKKQPAPVGWNGIWQWEIALVVPGNAYGKSPGFAPGSYSAFQDALDGADAFAIRWRASQGASSFPWWLVVVGYVATKGRR